MLPPRHPDYNGGVERGNRIFREKFYNQNYLLANNLAEMRLEWRKLFGNITIIDRTTT
ncbi:MAG: hypothetical protein LBF54_02050 [Holosporaceae bacterium]|nr:hypothetical protein [Holosporaceae bacterium]